MDAREVLGVGPDASDEAIRAAYVAKVKEFPPDRNPEEFERVRDAYQTLRDPRRRMRDLLFGDDPSEPFLSLVAGAKDQRRFTGPEPWLAVLKTR